MSVTLSYCFENEHGRLILTSSSVDLTIPFWVICDHRNRTECERHPRHQKILENFDYMHNNGLLTERNLSYMGFHPQEDTLRDSDKKFFSSDTRYDPKSEMMDAISSLRREEMLTDENLDLIAQFKDDRLGVASYLLIKFTKAGFSNEEARDATKSTIGGVLPDRRCPRYFYGHIADAFINMHRAGILTEQHRRELAEQGDDAGVTSEIFVSLSNAAALAEDIKSKVVKSDIKSALLILSNSGLLNDENIRQISINKSVPNYGSLSMEAAKALVELNKAGLYSRDTWAVIADRYGVWEELVYGGWAGWSETVSKHFGSTIVQELVKHKNAGSNNTPKINAPTGCSRREFQEKYEAVAKDESFSKEQLQFKGIMRQSLFKVIMSAAIRIYQNSNQQTGLLLNQEQINYLFEKAEVAEINWDICGIRKWWNKEEIGKANMLVEALCCRSYAAVKQVSETNTGYFSDIISQQTSYKMRTTGGRYFSR